jgi:DNA (cytosine-5)-methyltransferase 1
MWDEAIRAVRELKPRFAVFENVYGVLDYLDGCVLPEIESEDYKTEAICIPALAVGKNHQRKRWFIIAYPDGNRPERLQMFKEVHIEKGAKTVAVKPLSVCGGTGGPGSFPRIQGGNHGISFKMDRLKCLGNAVVPQIPELIFMSPAFDRWRNV